MGAELKSAQVAVRQPHPSHYTLIDVSWFYDDSSTGYRIDSESPLLPSSIHVAPINLLTLPHSNATFKDLKWQRF